MNGLDGAMVAASGFVTGSDRRPARLAWRLALALALVGTGCASPRTAPKEWGAWQARRLESVAGTNGWTTLAGLHWLAEGENSAGSDPTNQIVFKTTRAPGAVGVFTRRGEAVAFTAAPGAEVRANGRRIDHMDLTHDELGRPDRLTVGGISIVVIKRGARMGLRVRDPESAARRHFEGLRRFPYDPAWRIEGRFEPFGEAKTLRTPDVTGAVQEFPSPGALVFFVHGREQRLDVAVERDEKDYFIMFHDTTAGASTYGSGRFLYVRPPDASGKVIVDFNFAYTPPCGFTEYATCPLPPRQNWLPFPVPAGELKPRHGHHP